MTTNNAAELGKAIERKENEITIEGDLAKKVIKIKATGNVAWAIAGGAIVVAIVASLAAPAAVPAGGGPMGMIADSVALGAGGAGAVGVLGVSTTIAAISIGVGARNKNAVNKLRNGYTMEKISNSKIILHRNK